jgi:lysozyme
MNEDLVLTADDLTLTRSAEGCRLQAYQDSVGVWTIGFGHTGPDVHEGLVITMSQALALLLKDMGWAEQAVRAAVHIPLTKPEFIALTDFTFNVGCGAFDHSTLLTRLNAGDMTGVMAQFMLWNEAGGHVLAGLTARRTAEVAEFLTGIQPMAEVPNV